MTTPVDAKPNSDRELVLCRIIDAPRSKVWAAWSDPEKLKQWWAPRPWATPIAEYELRSGGSSRIVMEGPAGERFDQPGVFLEVVPGEKVVFTDAYEKPWVHREKAFMTAVLTFEDAGAGKTKYTARISHPTVADREQHEQMGFEGGWGICADQIEEVAQQS
ncbi:SRPBCC family protein [Terricaulis sp.]|uniref:SRPBCC family protein n=1 Tax=Terricaulis sp. TaxID=2768686 RepID=UPI0037836AF1